MKLRFIKYGKPAQPEYLTLSERFQSRIRRFVRLEPQVCKSSQDPNKDSEHFLKQFANGTRDYVIVCDERGQGCSSSGLAQLLQQVTDDPGIENLIVAVGGPFGWNQGVRSRADLLWQIGPGVLPSDLAWLNASEQLYRAYCLNHNIAYHH